MYSKLSDIDTRRHRGSRSGHHQRNDGNLPYRTVAQHDILDLTVTDPDLLPGGYGGTELGDMPDDGGGDTDPEEPEHTVHRYFMDWGRRLFQCMHHLNKITNTGRRASRDFIHNLGERVLTHIRPARPSQDTSLDLNRAMRDWGGTNQEHPDYSLQTPDQLALTANRPNHRLSRRQRILPFET